MAIQAARRFCGIWTLRNELCKYQHGFPPKSDTYTIVEDGPELSFAINGVLHNGAVFDFKYKGTPDGREHPFPVRHLADTLITKVEGDSLFTISKKGSMVNKAERRLSNDDKVMTVTQSGQSADGTPFSNISVYIKTEP